LTANNDVIDTVDAKDRGTKITTARQDVPVDMDAVSAPNLAKVRLVLEEQGANPNWKSRGDFYVQAVPRIS
jgi:hypothetical protein